MRYGVSIRNIVVRHHSLTYMEYVPGKPIVVPKRIVGKDQRVIATDNIFGNYATAMKTALIVSK